LYHIKLKNQKFTCQSNDSILAAARKQFIKIPYGCANGGCGMCKMKVVKGHFHLHRYSKGALNDQEREEGYVLSCKTIPLSDIELERIDS